MFDCSNTVRLHKDMAHRSSNRPTQRQVEALVDFLERNPGIAKGLLRTQQGKVETRRLWKEFATAANALGGVIKDGPGWAKYWSEKKCNLRYRTTQRSESMKRTGGGVDALSELTLLDQRLVAVMGGETFATGDRGLAVNPFPSEPSLSFDQPSTSTADNAEPMVVVIVAEDQLQNPPQPPSVEASQQEEATPQVETGHTGTRRARAPRVNQDRPSRSVTFLEAQVRRFEEIESRRVEAEMLNAQALAQIAAAFTELVSIVREHHNLERDRRDHPPNIVLVYPRKSRFLGNFRIKLPIILS